MAFYFGRFPGSLASVITGGLPEWEIPTNDGPPSETARGTFPERSVTTTATLNLLPGIENAGANQSILNSAAANGGLVTKYILPAGEYYHNNIIVFTSPVFWKGNSFIAGKPNPEGTMLRATNADFATMRVETNDVRFDNFCHRSPGGTRTGNGQSGQGNIFVNPNVLRFMAQDMIAWGSRDAAWHFYNCHDFTLNRCESRNSGSDAFHIMVTAHGWKLYDCRSYNCSDDMLGMVGYETQVYNGLVVRHEGKGQIHGRGFGFVHCRDIRIVGPTRLEDTSAAGVIFAREEQYSGGLANCPSTERVTIVGELRIDRANFGGNGENHGAIHFNAGPAAANNINTILIEGPVVLNDTSLNRSSPASAQVMTSNAGAVTAEIRDVKAYGYGPNTMYSGTGNANITRVRWGATKEAGTAPVYPLGSGTPVAPVVLADSAFTTNGYILEDFRKNTARIVHTGGGSTVVADGSSKITTVANGEVQWRRSLWSAILQGYDTLSLEVNFNGFTFSDFGDSPIFHITDASSQRRAIQLLRFATNGSAAWQTITVPLAKLTSGGDATPGTAGTGTPLDPSLQQSSLGVRIYNAIAGQQLSIRNVVVSDSTQAIKQDFTQPAFITTAKRPQAKFIFQGLDIMKLTKDNLRGQTTDAKMTAVLNALAPFNTTHIGVSVPYDDPSVYPAPQPVAGYALRWATAIRAAGKKVIWRQSPIAWEGIYDKPKDNTRGVGTAAGVFAGTETNTYLAQIYSYIVANASQYAAGDVLVPIPEPENGGINGVVSGLSPQFANADIFRRWLRDAITVTNRALDVIGLRGKVHVGWFGTSGFIVFGNADNPRGFLDDRTLDAMGIVGMDHYPSPITTLPDDLARLESLYGQRPLIITEWGTINESTDAARTAAAQSYLTTIGNKSYVYGFGYWTPIAGASNANENLIDSVTYAPIGAYEAIRSALNSG